MKSNAGLRLVLWSIVALALIALLVWGVWLRPNTTVPQTLSDGGGFGSTASRGSDGEEPAHASDGERAAVVDMGTEPLGEETQVSAVGALSIEWLVGEVRVVAYDGTDITFSDDYSGNETYRTVYETEGDELTIRYCEKMKLAVINPPEKTLLVRVPAALLKTLEVDTTSAKVEISGLCVEELDAQSMSGALSLYTCSADEIELETTSGSISCDTLTAPELQVKSVSGGVNLYACGADALQVSTTSGSIGAQLLDVRAISAKSMSGELNLDGTMKEAELETTSGAAMAAFAAQPERLDVDTISGEVTVTLPEDSRFRCDMRSTSGRLESELAVQGAGSDAPEYRFHTTSGNVCLKGR